MFLLFLLCLLFAIVNVVLLLILLSSRCPWSQGRKRLKEIRKENYKEQRNKPNAQP